VVVCVCGGGGGQVAEAMSAIEAWLCMAWHGRPTIPRLNEFIDRMRGGGRAHMSMCALRGMAMH
jgi:hypothetical protein